ncbi:MAG TPA: phospholipid carrier-dependent glycosyltransferase [Trebonia sp.]|nr:phospholipid carrier-dependent glycosyltransferase [Trebonia sp.]
MSGNLGTTGLAPGATRGTGVSPRAQWTRLRATAPVSVILLLMTALALAIRIFTLSRSGYLTGVTEYDDGVYLGGAIRLLQGALPYHDFAFVQPPGILLLMTPVALLTKFTTATHAMAAARILTALASTACVPLAGSLVRHRGALVTLVTSGILAVYPDDITTAHTLILEPWMNLLLMIGAVLAFRQGRLASSRRLLWAGVAIGVATSVKFWAGLPAVVLLVLILAWGEPTWRARGRRAVPYAIGVVIGFCVPVLPFAVSDPVVFVRSTLLDQATREGSYVPRSLRLAHITGLIDFLNSEGHISFTAGTHSLFANGGAAATSSTSAGWLPYAVTLLAIILVAAGYLLRPVRLSQLEAFALVTAVLASAAIMVVSEFFYHYPDFGAPWIAIGVGGAFALFSAPETATQPGTTGPGVAPLASAWRDRVRARLPHDDLVRAQRPVIGILAVALVLLATFQAREMAGLAAPDIYPDQAAIPAGKCVVTDQVSMALAADRFTNSPAGCPDVMDSLAETLVLSNGVSVQGGATTLPNVVGEWKTIFAKADYVWLSPNNTRRIPWTPGLTTWFEAHFVKLPVYGGLGAVYERIGDS